MRTQNGRFILYHRTDTASARRILENGFENSSEYFLSNRMWNGVLLSASPIDDCARNDHSLLVVKIDLDERNLSRWEWNAEGQNHREWLMPAGIVNKRAQVQLAEQLDASTVAA
jgi:hypothetical protein